MIFIKLLNNELIQLRVGFLFNPDMTLYDSAPVYFSGNERVYRQSSLEEKIRAIVKLFYGRVH